MLMPSTRSAIRSCPPPPSVPHLFSLFFMRQADSFAFPSVKTLHCITLHGMTALLLPVCWSSRKLTSLRGIGASARPPLTIFHSLSALQRWLHCTQLGHRPQEQNRRCCISAQHRRAGMTRHPASLSPFSLNMSCLATLFSSALLNDALSPLSRCHIADILFVGSGGGSQ